MDFSDFLPLFSRTESDIRLQLNADVNEGKNPEDDDYIDTREGSMYHTITQPFVLEQARIWDNMTTNAAVGFIVFAWGDYLDYHGEVLGVARKEAVAAAGEVTFTGDDGTVIPIGIEVSPTQTDPNVDVPTYLTIEEGVIAGGTVTLTVEARETGTIGNVSAGSIDTVLSNIEGDLTVDNVEAMLNGTEVEDDEDYMPRLLAAQRGHGPGNIADYTRWGLEEEGVGRVTVLPVADGPGTVTQVIMDELGGPVSSLIIDAHKLRLDPIDGQGHGLAPISAAVTVKTSAWKDIAITAEIDFEEGYSLDGGDGSISTREAIHDVLEEYLDQLAVGEDVVKNNLEAQFFLVEGIRDINMTVPAANVSVNEAADPPEKARRGTTTLTEA